MSTIHKSKAIDSRRESTLASNKLPILLIGPRAAGKTIVGKLLASQLKLPFINLGEIAENYWQESGYDQQLLDRAWDEDRANGVYRYLMPFEAQAIARVVAEHSNCVIELGALQSVYDDDELLQRDCVIDFGAGHSIYEDDEDLERANELFAPYSNVILLLPSPDLNESVEILYQRNQLIINGMEANRFIITHPAHRELATYVVYTEGQAPVETRDKILKYLQVKS